MSAELPVTLLPVKVRVPLILLLKVLELLPPKPDGLPKMVICETVLPETVLKFSASVPKFQMPPPKPSAVLPETVLEFSASVPKFRMPPPPKSAVLPETVLEFSVSVPELSMPPPLGSLQQRPGITVHQRGVHGRAQA